MKIAAIIPAAGSGKRFKAGKLKPLVLVTGKPLLIHTLQNLKNSWHFEELILVAPAGQTENFKKLLRSYRLGDVQVVTGGRTRAESVKNGFKRVSGPCDWVLVHDAARPLVSRAMVQRLIQGAKKTGAAIVGIPVSSTVKKTDRRTGQILGTQDRAALVLAQTPQIFKKDLLAGRYKSLGETAFLATDEAVLFDGSRVRVRVISGETRNIKITTLEDIELLKFYLKKKIRG